MLQPPDRTFDASSPTRPVAPTPVGEFHKLRLLDRVRHAIRVRHYSIRTEEAYVGWIRRSSSFIISGTPSI